MTRPRWSWLWATRRRKVFSFSVLLLPFFAYSSVELTSGPAFCSSCHEIGPAVESWRRSQHATIKGKERADCRDCHVPHWGNPLAVIWVKVRHGFKDLYHHWASDREQGFYFRAKQTALADVDDETCLVCHEEIRGAKDVIKTSEGVFRGLHASEEARKVPCTMCHKNTGHGPYQ